MERRALFVFLICSFLFQCFGCRSQQTVTPLKSDCELLTGKAQWLEWKISAEVPSLPPLKDILRWRPAKDYEYLPILDRYEELLRAQLKDFMLNTPKVGLTKSEIDKLSSKKSVIDSFLDVLNKTDTCDEFLTAKPSVYLKNLSRTTKPPGERASLEEVMEAHDNIRIAELKDYLLLSPQFGGSKKEIDVLPDEDVMYVFVDMLNRTAAFSALLAKRESERSPDSEFMIVYTVKRMNGEEMEREIKEYINAQIDKAKPDTYVKSLSKI